MSGNATNRDLWGKSASHCFLIKTIGLNLDLVRVVFAGRLLSLALCYFYGRKFLSVGDILSIGTDDSDWVADFHRRARLEDSFLRIPLPFDLSVTTAQ
jgi:hypothetical protein